MTENYRGRFAPSPTGQLHLGHARTFWMAGARARENRGTLVFRNDDLDRARCRPEYLAAAIEDLHWLKLSWSEGPDCGGPTAPYSQSERFPLYRAALEQLHRGGYIFPCTRSRRDVIEAVGAPHEGQGEMDEPIYPKSFRPDVSQALPALEKHVSVNWRFRIPEGEIIQFPDRALGPQTSTAGVDLGDFLVWRKDDSPSYQLACVVDDASMKITEVVRGADLITSTFRQLLLYRAFGWTAPDFFHCPLLNDAQGVRLAKRHDALSLKTLRESGVTAESLIEDFAKTYRALSS